MRCLIRRSLVAVLVAATVLGLKHFASEPLQAAVKKPAIPKFKIQYWDVPGRTGLVSLGAMNNLGQIVGWYNHISGEVRAYLYDPAISPTTAFDLEDSIAGAGVPDGWRIKMARDINDNGVIAGVMTTIERDPATGSYATWGFVLDTLAPSPEVILLPEVPGVVECFADQINNNGDIVGGYEADDGTSGFFFFNPAVHAAPYYLDPLVKGVELGEAVNGVPAMVGGRYGAGDAVYRCTPELGQFGSVSLGSSVTINDMNDAGVMVGQNSSWVPMRLINAQPQTFNLSGSVAYGLNNSNDVVFTKGYMYRDDAGTINLKSYLSGSSADLTLWNSSSTVFSTQINDRGAVSKFGQVGGYLVHGVSGAWSYQPFLLTPIVKTR